MRHTGTRYGRSMALVVVSLLITGWSRPPLRTVAVGAETSPEGMTAPLAPENPPSVEESRASDSGDAGQITGGSTQRGTCRVRYHPSYRRNRWMVVPGTLGRGGTYPVVLDTGASPAVVVNDFHIVENPVAVRPLAAEDASHSPHGTYRLVTLQIADFTLRDWPCYYAARHPATRSFGLTAAGDKAIIVGMPLLREFSYLAFDNVTQEVEFSLKEVFACESPRQWSQHPFSVEEDFGGNAYLFVEMPLAGRPVRLQLDTGSGRGLALAEKTWAQIRTRVGPVSLRKTKDLYPYLGRLDCRRGIIPRLLLGDRVVNQAQLSVFPDDSPLLEQAAGMLGMQCFQNTILVLDFQREQMWVRNTSTE